MNKKLWNCIFNRSLVIISGPKWIEPLCDTERWQLRWHGRTPSIDTNRVQDNHIRHILQSHLPITTKHAKFIQENEISPGAWISGKQCPAGKHRPSPGQHPPAPLLVKIPGKGQDQTGICPLKGMLLSGVCYWLLTRETNVIWLNHPVTSNGYALTSADINLIHQLRQLNSTVIKTRLLELKNKLLHSKKIFINYWVDSFLPYGRSQLAEIVNIFMGIVHVNFAIMILPFTSQILSCFCLALIYMLFISGEKHPNIPQVTMEFTYYDWYFLGPTNLHNNWSNS